jgi:2-dehydro-3-deoxyphosphooctonate aldolase (KDO 8-P synthase)
MTTAPAETITIGSARIANTLPFALISGPCQAEGVQHSLDIAGTLAELCAARGIALIFKASYDKANRTSLSGERGLGMEKGLECLAEVRRQIGCPVLSDVHDAGQCVAVAEVVDVLQIPAFLSRQTDLLLAAGATGAVVNVKKGQFLAPWDMANVAAKIASTGNRQIMLCERGTSFGYNTLVTDLTPPIPCSNPVGWAAPPAASVSSPRCWRGRRRRSGWPGSSSRHTRTRTMRPPMGQI